MRTRKSSERGGAILLTMIVLASLSILAGLTVVSVQGGIATGRNQRYQAIANYAAESGVAAAMVYLRNNVNADQGWSAFVTSSNSSPISPAAIPGNNILPLAPGNVFSPDMQAWYSIIILNNRTDTGFALSPAQDNDTVVRVHVIGYGPDGAVARVELEVDGKSNRTGASPQPVPPLPLVLDGWRTFSLTALN